MDYDIHLINAQLPLSPIQIVRQERIYFELKIKQGYFVDIQPQLQKWERADYKLLEQIEWDIHLSRQSEYVESKLHINLNGKIILPGLIDMHMHLDKAFSLYAADNVSGTLEEAIRSYSGAVSQFSREEISNRMYQAARMALSYGTTSIRSHLDFHINSGKEVAFRTIEAALETKEKLKGKMDIQFFIMTPQQQEHAWLEDAITEAIRMGIDGIGGAPHLAPNPELGIANIFRWAQKLDIPIDLHTDESDDPLRRTVLTIADYTERYQYQGKVTVDHLCSLSAMTQADAEHAIQRMVTAQLSAVTLPAVNLYLQGRTDQGIVRRGATRIRELLEANIPLGLASDNIQDAFHPLGRGDLIQIASLTSSVAHMGGQQEMLQLIEMITHVPAQIMKIQKYGIQLDHLCNMVIVDCHSIQQLFAGLAPSRWVYNKGNWQSVMKMEQQYAED